MKRLLPIIILLAFASFKASAGPYINATPQGLGSFHYTAGAGPSASQAIVLQSALMAVSSGNVTVTGTTNYEVSLNNSTFSSTVSIPYSGDTLAATNVYIRLKSGRSTGAYANEIINVTATGITQTVTASGLVTSPCVITTGAITATTASFSWNATGAASYECIINGSATSPTTAGTPTTTTSYSESSLSPGTAYYFHVRGVSADNDFTSWTTKAFSTATTSIAHTPGNYALSLTPNPNRGIFTLTGSGGLANKLVPISVSNALGQLVLQTSTIPESGAFSRKIELSAPAGLYVVRIGGNGEYGVMRFSIAP